MKKKLQLTETELIEFIEQTVKRIKKEKQTKNVKLNENDLYKIVDKVASKNKPKKKIQEPTITESKKDKKVDVQQKSEFKTLRESRRNRKVFKTTNSGDRKKIIK